MIYFHELNQILFTIIWNPTDGTYTIILETLVVMTDSVDVDTLIVFNHDGHFYLLGPKEGFLL